MINIGPSIITELWQHGFLMFIFSFPILKWMPIEDYAAQPFNQKQELFNYVAKICLLKSEKNYTGFSPLATTTGSGKVSYLYFNNQDNNHLATSDNQPLKV